MNLDRRSLTLPGIMIPILKCAVPAQRERVEKLLDQLRLNPRDIITGHSKSAAAVEQTLNDVAERGDDAIVESSRKFDDPNFSAEQIRVTPEEMKTAAGRVPAEVMEA